MKKLFGECIYQCLWDWVATITVAQISATLGDWGRFAKEQSSTRIDFEISAQRILSLQSIRNFILCLKKSYMLVNHLLAVVAIYLAPYYEAQSNEALIWRLGWSPAVMSFIIVQKQVQNVENARLFRRKQMAYTRSGEAEAGKIRRCHVISWSRLLRSAWATSTNWPSTDWSGKRIASVDGRENLRSFGNPSRLTISWMLIDHVVWILVESNVLYTALSKLV